MRTVGVVNTRNSHGVKSSCDQYRNIAGVHFECWTADTSEFDRERQMAKSLGLKTRTIDGQLYREVRQEIGLYINRCGRLSRKSDGE